MEEIQFPPQYSKEISQYQPSNLERTRAMKDTLDTVREFTHDLNIDKRWKNKFSHYERDVGL